MTRKSGIGNMIAPWRFLTFLVTSIFAVPAASLALGDIALGVMAGFDVAAVLFLVLSMPLLGTSEAQVIQGHANQNDANRAILLAITALVLVVLLFAIAAETVGQRPQPLTKVLVIVTLIVAWLFSNTIYAVHYAHLAYRRGASGCSDGIQFPGTEHPVYWDFVYFAFTLGMTFQTSDVQINDPQIRRTVVAHCFAAFIFNIGILAFTINVLGSP